ncbi:hypothetical protein ACPRNU_24885, partial [Chromobacterium vaccinii]|uniref:hypothetical protein n=1 Tax=Chromobacterium vaccinii TaxID=1108595 RepID=UPI003C77BF34
KKLIAKNASRPQALPPAQQTGYELSCRQPSSSRLEACSKPNIKKACIDSCIYPHHTMHKEQKIQHFI